MSTEVRSVVVLGAGIQGSCIALELARRQIPVTLIERDPIAMNRASLRNEGKIHLGLIYANDPTLATARLQLEGALNFRYLLKKWLGKKIDRVGISTPFYYLVAKDSIQIPAELQSHYRQLETIYLEIIQEKPDLDYLGTKPETLYRELSERQIGEYFVTEKLSGGFATSELAIDTEQLARLIREQIDESPLIEFLPGRTVASVETKSDRFQIEGDSGEGYWRIEAEQVVNATWENRLALDRSFGLPIAEGWLHRLKYRVIARLSRSLLKAPSATMVLGRYGDVVVRPDGTAYLSWYPSSLQGWTHDLQPPSSWDSPCRGEADPDTARNIARSIIENLELWFPGIGDCIPLQVDAGAILAYGKTDVDDRQSGLHDRTRVGVTSIDGYHSVDSGKLTTAPLFATLCADRVATRANLNF